MISSPGTSASVQAAYVYSIDSREETLSLCSASPKPGINTGNTSSVNTLFINFMECNPLLGVASSSDYLKVTDPLAFQRRKLYSLLSDSDYEDDSLPLSYFERIRSESEDSQAFEQIMKVFLGAYKKNDTLMVVKTLHFMRNFTYQEIGRVGLSATQIALTDNKNLDIQSIAISLVIQWKSKDFKTVMDNYQVPNDVFIKAKIRKLPKWYISEK